MPFCWFCHEAASLFFSENQPVCEKYLQWSCSDECKYGCMWITVDAFNRDSLKVPQFYGKVIFSGESCNKVFLRFCICLSVLVS